MMAIDEESLLCDLAEYYNVYSFTQLPLSTIAILASGLPVDSRIMRKFSKMNVTLTEQLLAAILDDFNSYIYSFSKDSKQGINKPKSIVNAIMHAEEIAKDKPKAFVSSEDYEKARARILGGKKWQMEQH